MRDNHDQLSVNFESSFSKLSFDCCCVGCFVKAVPEKEELEPWLVKEMDKLLSEVWLTGNEELFQQIFHYILSENVSG